MENNIVQIDLGKIDAEIAELRQKIDLLLNTKKYAQKIAINGNNYPSQSMSNDIPPNMGVSDFLLLFLKNNGRVDTKIVKQAYASYTKKSVDDIGGNVSNALSRLKSERKIDNKENPGGRKSGSVWFIIS